MTEKTVLHRLPLDRDFPVSSSTLRVWECVGRLDHYLVCNKCHDEAIVH